MAASTSFRRSDLFPAYIFPADNAHAPRVDFQRFQGSYRIDNNRRGFVGTLEASVDLTMNSLRKTLSVESFKSGNKGHDRRKSNVELDAIHEFKGGVSPAQIYSTESGRLFHAGRILICMVGLPARGKTHMAVSLTRYLRWLGVNAHTFHLGDYRRQILGAAAMPNDYFYVNASPETVKLRQKFMGACRQDMLEFFNDERGQVAIYDAVNPTAAGRRGMAKDFAKHDVKILFLESRCEDPRIIEANVRGVKISSPDYKGWEPEEAVRDYLQRINARIPHFETLAEPELSYIKMININEKIEVNTAQFGYIANRIVFYLMNLHTRPRCMYFATAGKSVEERSYKADAPLSKDGQEYSTGLADALIKHRQMEFDTARRHGDDNGQRKLKVWTSTRLRTVQTADEFAKRGFPVTQRLQLRQLNPGVCENLSPKEVAELYPEEIEKHEQDPYHHRFPRAESYHDIAVRLEPVIMELERETDDIVLIAHDTVLRVLYAYFMATSTVDIPTLEFSRSEIIEIIPSAYHNRIERIKLSEPES